MTPLAQLRCLIRTAENGDPEGRELGPWLAENAAELADDLGTTPEDLVASADVPDGVIAKRVTARLKFRRGLARESKSEAATALASCAAGHLGRAAEWTERGATLNVGLLLGDVLADRGATWLEFVDHGNDDVHVERALVAKVAKAIRGREGITAWVDPAGLHLRFGRGGFNLAKASRGQVAPGDTRTVVALAPRATVADAAE